jgi:hypothetical protein
MSAGHLAGRACALAVLAASCAQVDVEIARAAPVYKANPKPPTGGLVGSDYTPAYAVNQVQLWHDFRADVIEKELAAAIGERPAVLILEPDALAQIDLYPQEKRRERYGMIRDAVEMLTRSGSADVYIDAGNSAWIEPEEMARRLRKADIGKARGFALNVSNFQRTGETLDYGRRLSALVDGKHFVIDTSRNGNGPLPPGADREGYVSNAVKYTESGRVELNVRGDDEWATVEVADTGMGIPEKDVPLMLCEFFRASNAKRPRQGGTGVGLAGAKRLVERFGGEIEFRSVENEGPTFTIRLPRTAPPPRQLA